MAVMGFNFAGSIMIGRKTVAFGAPISCLVPPGGAYGRPNFDTGVRSKLLSHITSVLYTSAGTAHTVTLMRPLNYTTFAADAAINQAVVALAADPGIYSTNYKNPLANGKTAPAAVADNGIAASDWVAYQLVDGTWVMDTVASGTFGALTLTTAIPNITGGGVKAGGLFFFFGVAADSNPQDGLPHPRVLMVASTVKEQVIKDTIAGGFSPYNPGDPVIVQSDNITATGFMEGIEGFYSKV